MDTIPVGRSMFLKLEMRENIDIEKFEALESSIRTEIIEFLKTKYSLKDFCLAGLDKSYVHRILGNKTKISTPHLIQIYKTMEQYNARKSVEKSSAIVVRFDDAVISQ